MGFGQHQTFYLRQQWLTKGLIEVQKNPRFFYDPNHFEVLGVGKNMAKSIRFWLTTTKLVREERSSKTELRITELGKVLFKYDKYFKKEFTLSLLHYLLVTEKEDATAWYWFFNEFNERVFTKKYLYTELEKWTVNNVKKSVSINSLKRDIDCLIQLYTSKDFNDLTPEDVIRSPFESLNILKNSTSTNFVKSPLVDKEIYNILFISLLIYLEKNNTDEVSLDNLISGTELWGKVFNLNRDSIIDYLNTMQNLFPIKFTRTNRLDVIRITETRCWLDEVKSVYEKEVK